MIRVTSVKKPEGVWGCFFYGPSLKSLEGRTFVGYRRFYPGFNTAMRCCEQLSEIRTSEKKGYKGEGDRRRSRFD